MVAWRAAAEAPTQKWSAHQAWWATWAYAGAAGGTSALPAPPCGPHLLAPAPAAAAAAAAAGTWLSYGWELVDGIGLHQPCPSWSLTAPVG